MDRAAFLEACRFAKVVGTSNGPALLIGGYVIHVNGPYVPDHLITGFEFTDAIAAALRNPAPLSGDKSE